MINNQKDSGDPASKDFVELGEYNCATSSCAVTVSAANGQASADAVRWTLMSTPTTAATKSREVSMRLAISDCHRALARPNLEDVAKRKRVCTGRRFGILYNAVLAPFNGAARAFETMEAKIEYPEGSPAICTVEYAGEDNDELRKRSLDDSYPLAKPAELEACVDLFERYCAVLDGLVEENTGG